MTGEELEQLRARWDRLTPMIFDLLDEKDCVRGVMLVSAEDAGDDALSLAEHVCDAVIPYEGHKKAEWEDTGGFLKSSSLQQSFLEKIPEYPCVLVSDLDQTPEWLWYWLKGLMERGPRPCVVVATARDPEKIPGWLSSHFWHFEKAQSSP